MSTDADLSHNPLLDFRGLPRFADIQPSHVAPAMDHLLAQALGALAQATSPETPADYEALSATLDVATEQLSRAWGAVGHLNAVADTPELRAAYTDALPKVTEFWTALGQDEALYAKYKAVHASQGAHLSAARRKALSDSLRGFVLGGAELPPEPKKRFAAIQERQATLAQQFSEHVMDATDRFAYFATDAEMAGVPDDAKAAARAAAEKDGKAGHKLTLHFPSYFPVMQYAQDRALRRRLYTAYATRASGLNHPEVTAVGVNNDPALDNSAILLETLRLRAEEARLLGYGNYAEVSLVTKMAQSPAQVMAFLRDLAAKARPHAERDLAELREFARQHLGLDELQAWDVAYASEKLREARYAFSETEVKQYFTEPAVLAGLFKIIETLFEVRIREVSPGVRPLQTWHPSVKLFQIERSVQQAHSGHIAVDAKPEVLAHFYLDPHARPGKRPGAWMDDVRSRWRRPDTGDLQTPVAHLVCNASEGVGGRPATLTHDDVITLFHESGHGLHHLLTQVSDMGVSGISGVEWDAVELPSQFMENFCWEWDVVKHMTRHVDTGEPLPRPLFDKMLAAKNFQAGLATLRQVEFALFDMLLHSEFDPGAAESADAALALLDQVRDEVSVMKPPSFNRMPHSFSHIFAGGYAAGYYSYKWAEVLSADAYAAFEEQRVDGSPLNPAVGRRYREAILEAGGARPALESFVAFRGREPTIDALLRHQGMAP
jgi:oligopeptidase A